MTFLKLKYYFIKFKVYIYICGAVLVLLVFAVLLRKVNPFTRADSQTLLGIIGTLLGAVVGAVFTLLGSIWVNTQQKKEEWNRKRAREIYRPLYDELVNIHRNILKENPYPVLIEFRAGHQTIKPHPQYVEWRKIELDSRYLQVPMELKKQMERLFEAVDDYLIKRETASDEVKRILDSVLEEFKLPLCRLENFGSVVLGEVMSGKEQGVYKDSIYFMEEDTPDESVIEKVNARFYEIADGSTVLEKMKEIYHVWMREEEAAIKMLELLIRIAEK
ncbi:hypothetical protein [Clostridium fessum]|uniref:hypothetical protein n=1 Tax=Clostridium fessum TaxID=2126740 RepID=UPI002E779E64|nr:hypothetical protein [Clostridium fessum]